MNDSLDDLVDEFYREISVSRNLGFRKGRDYGGYPYSARRVMAHREKTNGPWPDSGIRIARPRYVR